MPKAKKTTTRKKSTTKKKNKVGNSIIPNFLRLFLTRAAEI